MKRSRFWLIVTLLVILAFVTIVPVEMGHASAPVALLNFSGPVVTGLPFAVGDTWYFTQNFHGPNALDFQTTNGKPGTVIAADDGIVISATQTCTKVRRSDGLILGYQHIEPADIAKLIPNTTQVIKGVTVIGRTTGKWTNRSTGCGGISAGNLVHFWTEPNFQTGSVIGGYTVGDICGSAAALLRDGTKYCPAYKNHPTPDKVTNSQLTEENKGATIDTSKIYALKNVNSGKVLDVLELKSDDGAWVTQWDYHGGANQQITFEPVNMGDGRNWYSLKFSHSGKYLVVKQASREEGMQVFQYTGNGDDNAKWLLIPQGDGKYSLQNRKSGLVLAIAGSNIQNNAALVQYRWLNIADQLWTLQVISTSPSALTPPPAPPIVFDKGSSSLWQDQNWGRANLKVCADNLSGNTVYAVFSRAGREWKYSQIANSNCVTFWDMDGSGPLNGNTIYNSRAALNQWPDSTWPAPGCAGPSGGKGLCDSILRP